MIETTYPFYGLVERSNFQNMVKSYFIFSPRSVLNNKQDLELLPNDTIILFNEDQINIISDKFFSFRSSGNKKITQNFDQNRTIQDNISNQDLQLDSLLSSNGFDNNSKLEGLIIIKKFK